MFYTIAENWISNLEKNTKIITDELEFFIANQSKNIKDYYHSYTSNNGWKTIPLYFFTIPDKEILIHFPRTQQILNSVPQLISAEFSILEPNTIIKSHEGYSKQVMRTHLGLKIPDGDLGLKSVEEIKKWQQGKTFSFNDGYIHEAWNKSDKQRWVLMIDTPIPNSNYNAFDISKYKLETITDPVLLSIAPKEKWLEWLYNSIK